MSTQPISPPPHPHPKQPQIKFKKLIGKNAKYFQKLIGFYRTEISLLTFGQFVHFPADIFSTINHYQPTITKLSFFQRLEIYHSFLLKISITSNFNSTTHTNNNESLLPDPNEMNYLLVSHLMEFLYYCIEFEINDEKRFDQKKPLIFHCQQENRNFDEKRKRNIINKKWNEGVMMKMIYDYECEKKNNNINGNGKDIKRIHELEKNMKKIYENMKNNNDDNDNEMIQTKKYFIKKILNVPNDVHEEYFEYENFSKKEKRNLYKYRKFCFKWYRMTKMFKWMGYENSSSAIASKDVTFWSYAAVTILYNQVCTKTNTVGWVYKYLPRSKINSLEQRVEVLKDEYEKNFDENRFKMIDIQLIWLTNAFNNKKYISLIKENPTILKKMKNPKRKLFEKIINSDFFKMKSRQKLKFLKSNVKEEDLYFEMPFNVLLHPSNVLNEYINKKMPKGLKKSNNIQMKNEGTLLCTFCKKNLSTDTCKICSQCATTL